MNKTVYITGASGLVGRYAISDLLDNTSIQVVAVSSCPDTVKSRHGYSSRFRSIGYGDFLDGLHQDGGVNFWCIVRSQGKMTL